MAQRFFQTLLDHDFAAAGPSDQIGDFQYQPVDVGGAGLKRLLPREGEQALRQFLGAGQAVERVIEMLGCVFRLLAHVPRAFDIQHRRQHQVIEIMRDAAGKLADHLHALRLQ